MKVLSLALGLFSSMCCRKRSLKAFWSHTCSSSASALFQACSTGVELSLQRAKDASGSGRALGKRSPVYARPAQCLMAAPWPDCETPDAMSTWGQQPQAAKHHPCREVLWAALALHGMPLACGSPHGRFHSLHPTFASLPAPFLKSMIPMLAADAESGQISSPSSAVVFLCSRTLLHVTMSVSMR